MQNPSRMKQVGMTVNCRQNETHFTICERVNLALFAGLNKQDKQEPFSNPKNHTRVNMKSYSVSKTMLKRAM